MSCPYISVKFMSATHSSAVQNSWLALSECSLSHYRNHSMVKFTVKQPKFLPWKVYGDQNECRKGAEARCYSRKCVMCNVSRLLENKNKKNSITFFFFTGRKKFCSGCTKDNSCQWLRCEGQFWTGFVLVGKNPLPIKSFWTDDRWQLMSLLWLTGHPACCIWRRGSCLQQLCGALRWAQLATTTALCYPRLTAGRLWWRWHKGKPHKANLKTHFSPGPRT